MREIILKARGKINLSLDITGKRKDGYHLVDMVMQSVDIYDTIKIQKRDDKEIVVFCDNKDIPLGDSNIVYKAAKLIISTFELREGVSIDITKRIPVAAGMAGGSTDAAAVLIGMNHLFNMNLKEDALEKLGLKIGADVPFCINGGTHRAKGIGEVLTKVPFMDMIILICKPEASVSTEQVYRKFNLEGDYKRPNNELLIEGLYEKSLDKVTTYMANALESVTMEMVLEVKKIKDIMKRGNAIFSMMTGSGPTVFGIYKTIEDAKLDYEILSKDFKDTYITRTSKGGVEIESRNRQA